MCGTPKRWEDEDFRHEYLMEECTKCNLKEMIIREHCVCKNWMKIVEEHRQGKKKHMHEWRMKVIREVGKAVDEGCL